VNDVVCARPIPHVMTRHKAANDILRKKVLRIAIQPPNNFPSLDTTGVFDSLIEESRHTKTLSASTK
jgi:hypothetical protein